MSVAYLPFLACLHVSKAMYHHSYMVCHLCVRREDIHVLYREGVGTLVQVQ